MGKTKKKVKEESVPYVGQLPHCQGKRPGPLICFSFNLKNALKRAFPSFKHKGEASSSRWKSRIERIMDLLEFDINQLLIYENQKKRCKKPSLINQLRTMKFKAQEIKTISCSNRCLLRAEVMLKRRCRLKCTSRSLRRGLIEFMSNIDQADKRSKIVCEIMSQLDAMDLDITGLCKSVKQIPKALTCDIQTAAEFESAVTEQKNDGDVGQCHLDVCEEVMRPYDPVTDDDAQSIHLRYVPALDSFKANMERNPCALRLPLMGPSMKRIMNKMKLSYLMDDVPCKLEKDENVSNYNNRPAVSYINVLQKRVEDENQPSGMEDVGGKVLRTISIENFGMQMIDKGIHLYDMKYISQLWLPKINQIKQIYS